MLPVVVSLLVLGAAVASDVELFRKIIEGVDQQLAEKHFDLLHYGNLTFGNFSSILLVGDDQEVNRTAIQGGFEFHFRLRLGLDEVRAIAKWDTGYVVVSGAGNQAQVTGVLRIGGTGCAASLEGGRLLKTGRYSVYLQSTTCKLTSGLVGYLAQGALNNVLPLINNQGLLDRLVQRTALEIGSSPLFTALLCRQYHCVSGTKHHNIGC